ncbi:hypothetical protein [Paenibacillus luteus]|nr:hypothetical protein [Paenibacillus luteus]
MIKPILNKSTGMTQEQRDAWSKFIGSDSSKMDLNKVRDWYKESETSKED